MKKTFQVTIRIKGCDTVFNKELGTGVIGKVDLIYDIKEKDLEDPRFLHDIERKAETFMKSMMVIDIKEKK